MDRLSDYDYVLPESSIAQAPLEDRSASKLLWLNRETGKTSHHLFNEIPKILRPGDLLVLNETRVTAVRLFGSRTSGGKVEVLLLRELVPGEYLALARPAKRLLVGTTVEFGGELRAAVSEVRAEGQRVLRFEPVDNLDGLLSCRGEIPLPPYIHTQLDDPNRYQTVYSASGGSAAAPTAGLHFTIELLEELRHLGLGTATISLDVGIDTFRPVAAEDLAQHVMHGEHYRISEKTADAVAHCEGRIVAVGTTTVRALESAAEGKKRRIRAGSGESKLFIRPGFQFRVVDGMFTNFHLPRTTMLMMISALVGKEAVFSAYETALSQDYRFLSFGDSMLIL